MTLLDTGTYGAKIQSWAIANPRELLLRLEQENPSINKEQLYVIFRDFLRSDDGADYFDTIAQYAYANAWNALHPAQTRRRKKIAAAAERVAVEQVKEKIKQIGARAVLDTIMPNGKSLRDCTFRYLTKLGGACARLAAKGKPNEIVGKILSEQQARKLYGEV